MYMTDSDPSRGGFWAYEVTYLEELWWVNYKFMHAMAFIYRYPIKFFHKFIIFSEIYKRFGRQVEKIASCGKSGQNINKCGFKRLVIVNCNKGGVNDK